MEKKKSSLLPASRSAEAEELEVAWAAGWGSGVLLPKASKRNSRRQRVQN